MGLGGGDSGTRGWGGVKLQCVCAVWGLGGWEGKG